MSPLPLRLHGIPAGYSEKLLRAYFETYGEVLDAQIPDASGVGYVRLDTAEAAAEVLKDSDDIELGGKKVEVSIGSAPVDTAAGAGALPLVKKEEELVQLDVCVIRGARTKTAVGLAQRLAQAKTRVVCIWDRRSREESVKAGLTTEEYDYRSSLAAEAKDKEACAKADELASTSQTSKVAVVHFVSDQMAVASEAFPDGAMNHPQELLDVTSGNHMETISVLKAGTVYADFIFKYGGALFVVFPEFSSRWSHDIALSSTAVHRACRAGLVSHHRYTQAPQPTVGLQLLDGVPAAASAETISRTVAATLSMPAELMGSLDMKTLAVGK